MFVIPYILPMMLGRTYDYNTAIVRLDIFSDQNLQHNTQEISNYKTSATFSLIEQTTDVNSLMDVRGDLSVKIASGLVDVSGMGSYLREKLDKSTSVEVLCRVKYETVTRTLTTHASPLPLWMKFNRRQLGTHFVRSITYGGELVASLNLRAKTLKDAKNIRAQLSAGLGIAGTLDLSANGQFTKVLNKASESVNLEIKYYGTVPIEDVPQDLPGLQRLIKDFPQHVGKVSNGIGNPIRAELMSLGILSSGDQSFNFLQSAAISNKMSDINIKYDDILTTVKELRAWTSKLGELSAQHVDEISVFRDRLDAVNSAFYEAILNMDITQNGDPNQFQACLKLYKGSNVFSLPGQYMRDFRKLRAKIMNEIAENEFSNPLTNVGVFRENVFDIGKSERLPGAVTIELCKEKCRAEATCKSITYYLTKSSAGLTPNSADICFINFVNFESGELIPVPHIGEANVRIYLRGRNFTWDDTVPRNLIPSFDEDRLSLSDDLVTQNSDFISQPLKQPELHLVQQDIESAAVNTATKAEMCPPNDYYAMCNETSGASSSCFSVLCPYLYIANKANTNLCTDIYHYNDVTECQPCCNRPLSNTKDALLQSCQEPIFYQQCGGEALCLEPVSKAIGSCVRVKGECRNRYTVYGKIRIYSFCRAVYLYTGRSCTGC